MKKLFVVLLAAVLSVSAISVMALTVVEEIIDVPVVESPEPPPEEEPVEEEAETVPEDKVSFLNGDTLKGLLVSVDPKKGGVTWQSPYSVKPLEMSLDAADRVVLKPRGGAGKKWGSASIHLSNGDELWGDIISLGSGKLELKTWYSGKVEIHRPMIARIKVQNRDSSVMYEGPNSLAEWKTRQSHGRGKSWEYKKGALYAASQYPIARKIEDMPDKVKIEFDLKWRGSYPGMGISFFNDNVNHQSDCYTITISGSSIYLYRYSRNSGSSHLGNADYRAFNNGDKRGGSFTILADRKEKTVALLIDGQMVRQWTDKAGQAHDGNVLMFYPQNQNGMQISNIKVAEWDGQVPTAVGDTGEKSTEDLIRLANGDKVSGEVLTIDNAAIKFKASYADMDIPLTRIVEIIFAEDKRERARRNQYDSKFTMVNGGIVTFDLQKIMSDEATGQSENFGTVTLPLSAVRELEFNLYAEKLSGDDFEF